MENTATEKTNGDGLTDRIYGAYSVVGGKSSEVPLRRTWHSFLDGSIAGKDVLVTGVGDGIEAGLAMAQGPASLWLSDYNESAATGAHARLSERNGHINLQALRLDVSDLLPLGDQQFDVIFCNSVLMHLPLPQSTEAIVNLAKHLRRGGKMCVGVFASQIARKKFYPLTETVGVNWFCPQLRGLRTELDRRPTEHDIPNGAVIREFYPEGVEQEYLRACYQTGFGVRYHPATILPGECQDSIYKKHVGEALWHVYEVFRS